MHTLPPDQHNIAEESGSEDEEESKDEDNGPFVRSNAPSPEVSASVLEVKEPVWDVE